MTTAASTNGTVQYNSADNKDAIKDRIRHRTYQKGYQSLTDVENEKAKYEGAV